MSRHSVTLEAAEPAKLAPWPLHRRTALLGGIVAAGIALRLAACFCGRGIWLDEAALALNVADRGYADLLRPLDHDQAAPAGFLVATKLLVSVLGDGALALRLIPLLCGLGILPLFYLVARRTLAPAAVPLAMALVAFCDSLIYFSAEFKQYSSETAIAVGLLWAALATDDGRPALRHTLALALVGAVAVWCSYSAVFVLTGIGAAWLLTDAARRSGGRFRRHALIAVLWGASALVLYVVALRPAARSDFLDQFWSGRMQISGAPEGGAFMPAFPRSLADLRWFLTNSFALFEDPGGFKLAGVAALCFWIGVLKLLRGWPVSDRAAALPQHGEAPQTSAAAVEAVTPRTRFAALALLLSLAAAGVASAVHLYPFAGRLLLFAVPGLMLGVAHGANALREQLRPVPGAGALLFLLLLLHPVSEVFYHAARPIRTPQVHSALAYVQAHRQAADLLYVYYGADPTFTYYARRWQIAPNEYRIGVSSRDDWSRYWRDLDSLRGSTRVWLLFAHARFELRGVPTDEESLFLFRLNQIGRQLDVYHAPGATAYLYDLRTATK